VALPWFLAPFFAALDDGTRHWAAKMLASNRCPAPHPRRGRPRFCALASQRSHLEALVSGRLCTPSFRFPGTDVHRGNTERPTVTPKARPRSCHWFLRKSNVPDTRGPRPPWPALRLPRKCVALRLVFTPSSPVPGELRRNAAIGNGGKMGGPAENFIDGKAVVRASFISRVLDERKFSRAALGCPAPTALVRGCPF